MRNDPFKPMLWILGIGFTFMGLICLVFLPGAPPVINILVGLCGFGYTGLGVWCFYALWKGQ